jgi:hypothetical protein
MKKAVNMFMLEKDNGLIEARYMDTVSIDWDKKSVEKVGYFS